MEYCKLPMPFFLPMYFLGYLCVKKTPEVNHRSNLNAFLLTSCDFVILVTRLYMYPCISMVLEIDIWVQVRYIHQSSICNSEGRWKSSDS